MRRGWFVTLAVVLVAVAVTPALAQDRVSQRLVTPIMPPSCDGCIYDKSEVGYPKVGDDGPFEPKATPLRARSGSVELPGLPTVPALGVSSIRGQLGNPSKSGLGFISTRGGSAGLSPAEEADRQVRNAIRKLG
jgi:hypothetical protein